MKNILITKYQELKSEILCNYGYRGWYDAVKLLGYSLDEVDETKVRKLWYGHREIPADRMCVLLIDACKPITQAQYTLAIQELEELLKSLRIEFKNIKRKEARDEKVTRI